MNLKEENKMPALKGNKEKYVNGVKVDKENDDVIYNDEKHLYLSKKDNSKYISVTTLIHEYTNPFNESFWASYKACEWILGPEGFKPLKKILLQSKLWKDEYLDTYNIDKKLFESKRNEIIQSYANKRDEACLKGTIWHSKMEELFYQGDQKTISKYCGGGEFDVKKGYYKLDVDRVILPEFLISYEFDKYLKISGQIDLLQKADNEIVLIDWKGLPLDTLIPTPTGFITMKDLQVGDEVFDKNGDITLVKHKSNIHYNPCYKIKFDNGDEIVCDEDHRWEVCFSHKTPSFVLTANEIYEHFQKTGNRHAGAILRVMNAKPIDLPEKNLPIHPYLLGVWLGDGTSAAGSITQRKGSKVWETLENIGCHLGNELIHDPKRQNVSTRTVFGLYKSLRTNNLLNNKHIPEEYFRASYRQRLLLLQGLMDTDGYYHPKRKRFVIGVGKKWQADDSTKLLATFGIKATRFDVTKTHNGKKFKAYDVCFTTNILNPFLSRHQNLTLPTSVQSKYRRIKSIERTELVPTQCIEVTSPTHTYLCTDKFIVTHNTNGKIDKDSYFDQSTKKRQMMKFPLENLPDCNFYHYSLQLSLYAYMLQQINPKFRIKKLMIVHFDHNGGETEYEVEYLKEDVARMLLHYRKQQKIKSELAKDKPIVF